MKVKKEQVAFTSKPILNDLIERGRVQKQTTLDKINGVDSKPLEQPDLYQDGGSGYNRNFVFPQD